MSRSRRNPKWGAHRNPERWGETPSSPDLQWIEIRARRSLAPPGSWEAPFRFCACIGTMNRPLTRPSGTLSPLGGGEGGVRGRFTGSPPPAFTNPGALPVLDAGEQNRLNSVVKVQQ